MEWTDYKPDEARSALRAWIGEASNDAETADAIEDYRIDLIIEAARRRGIDPNARAALDLRSPRARLDTGPPGGMGDAARIHPRGARGH